MSATTGTIITRSEPSGSGSGDGRAADLDILTASPRRALRRRAGLIVVIAVILLGAVVIAVIRGAASSSSDPLAIDNPAPQGARAVAQVLGQHGVRVIAADSLRATQAAVASASDTTVLVSDPSQTMSSAQRAALLQLGTDVVVVEPGLLALDDLAPELGLAGELSGTLSAGCEVPAAAKAGTVSASGLGYRVIADDPSASACFSRSGVSGLIQLTDGDRTISVLGLGSTLENGTIARRGDAALALNLLGGHRTLVWYISSYADLQAGAGRDIADLTPAWVTPLLVLFGLAAIGAMVWRGRRFGPIVVENLPVVVRASETMEGRARLYSRAGARLRALDALRIGTIERLARLAGLPRAASVDQVVDATAALLGRDRGEVASLLLDAIPDNDAALVHFSDLLITLEADVAKAARR